MLDITKYVSEIQKSYSQNADSFSALIMGEMGSGKTFMMSTAPRPVFIDSFDKGGSKGLADWIRTGEIIVDSRWEKDDPENPTVFNQWAQEMVKRSREGFFDYIGTYVLDSSTTWTAAAMSMILKKRGAAGQTPVWEKDFGPLKTLLVNTMQRIMNMPCNFITLGHLETIRDDITGRLIRRFMITGRAKIFLPLLFDEVWVMDPKETSKGVEYRVLTQATGVDLARSRLAKNGLLSKYENPNLTMILKKANWPIRTPKPFTKGA